MKKITALKTYVFAPYSLKKGESMTVPDKVGKRLADLGFVECGPVEDAKGAKTATAPSKGSGDKEPAPAPKSAQRGAQKPTAAKK